MYGLQKVCKLLQITGISLDNSIDNNWAKYQSIWIKFCGSSSVHRFWKHHFEKNTIVLDKIFFFFNDNFGILSLAISRSYSKPSVSKASFLACWNNFVVEMASLPLGGTYYTMSDAVHRLTVSSLIFGILLLDKKFYILKTLMI